jgi:hypothetical protein
MLLALLVLLNTWPPGGVSGSVTLIAATPATAKHKSGQQDVAVS